jgi:hypothetical protein
VNRHAQNLDIEPSKDDLIELTSALLRKTSERTLECNPDTVASLRS